MFSLIWYFGLISFVVSVHSNNDTLHGGYKLNISTTMSTLPSATIPVAKDCVLEMKESEISEIVELFNNDRVHVVDIHVSFSNTTHDKELSNFHVKLLNPVGREILYSLKRFRFSTWTLNAGIRNFKLHVNESQNDCIERHKNVTDFAFEIMQNIVRRVNLASNYEVWYSFKETSSGKVQKICCQITKHNLPKCNHGCSKGNSFLYASEAPWVVIIFMMILFALLYLTWLLHVVLSRTEFDLEYPKYYKLEESRMSPSFTLFKITFEDYGRVVSFFRSCALVGVLSYFTFLLSMLYQITKVLPIVSVFWGLSFVISYLYRSKSTNSLILRGIKERHKNLSLQVPDVNGFRQGLESLEFAGVIKILTLPFNGSYWRRVIKLLYDISASSIERVRIKLKNRILKILTLGICYVLAVLICFLVVVTIFSLQIMQKTAVSLLRVSEMFVLIHHLKYKYSWYCPFGIHHAYLTAYFFFTLIVMTLAIQSFLLGLFLNLIHFIPYFAFFSVLTFYCGNFWKTMEENYLVLKRLIYEACRDIEHVNNGCIPNRHPKREENVLPVVSKELYNKIRETLLPYDTNLFYFALKIFWAFAFSFGILKLIEMLNEFNVPGVVQVITTASLGVMPHIFNMIALKTSEEKKKAREEKLKLNVKYMVEDLLRENPELARTVLIIQQNNGTTVQVSESDMNATGNDDAEGSELTDVLITQENNDTTADGNVQDSETIESLLKLLPLVYCNPIRRVFCYNDATTEENVQHSEHPCVDDDVEDPELTRLVQEVYGTTTDEIVQDSDHPCNNGDDVEDPELTRLLQEVYGTTTDKNVQDSDHPSDDAEDPELTSLLQEVYGKTRDEIVQDSEHPFDDHDVTEDPEPRLRRLREVHDTTTDENVHDTGNIEARSASNLPDNDNVEDPELARTALIIKGFNTAADEIDQHSENVQGTSDLNPPDRDDVEEFPIAIVHAQPDKKNVE